MGTYYVATTGNDTTGDGSSGNPYASPGKAAGVATTAGDKIYVKSGTYTLTTSTANVAGGRVSLADSVTMEGYGTTAGDLAARPVISAGSIGSISVVTYTQSNTGPYANSDAVVNIEVDGNSQSSVTGFNDTSQFLSYLYGCVARNCTTGFNARHPVGCASYSCGTGFSGVAVAVGCYARGGTSGFTGNHFFLCVADAPSGNGFAVDYGAVFANCVAYGCGSHGFSGNWGMSALANCIAYGCGGYGVHLNGYTPAAVTNCAYGSNTSGNFSATPRREVGGVSLSGNPFTNAAGHDFSLNTTAGAGAACRAAGLPGTFPGGSTTGYLDIGAVQHQDAGGTTVYSPSRIIQSPGWAYLEG